MILLALAAGLPVAVAYAAIGPVMRLPMSVASTPLRIGLAIPLGLGASSLFAHGWLVAGGSLGRGFAVADAVLFAGILAALRPWARPREQRAPAAPLRALDWAAVVLAAVGIAVAAVSFLQAVSVEPTGGWDAWAIWNQHARFLFRGGEGWRTLFDKEMSLSHNEYPLLLPGAIARLWAYSGESVSEPALVAGLFALSTPLVVFGAVARRSGYVAGTAATLLLLATDSWLSWSSAQYADVPLAAFVTAAAACVVSLRRDGPPPSVRELALAGAFLGLCAWTKDEGVVLAALFGAWLVVLTGGPPLRRRALAVAAGAALPLAVRAHFQVALSPGFSANFTADQTIGTLVRRLLVADRWAIIARDLPQHLPGAEAWLPLVAIAAVALLEARWRELPRSPALPALAAWGTFLLVYGVTPLDLRWHIGTSASRVFLQPWPALLMGLFGMAGATRASAIAGVERAASPSPSA